MKQRSDLTFKHNLKNGRHGWLRLTPAYSLKVVQKYLPTTDLPINLLDPFSGSGTTPLSASYEGYNSFAIELNPFLVWFARVKTKIYSSQEIEDTIEISEKIISQFLSKDLDRVDAPPIRNIERWWNKAAIHFLRSIKWGIEKERSEDVNTEIINLLYVAFSRTLIKLSNTSNNHQSLSFNDDKRQPDLFEVEKKYVDIFRSDVSFVTKSARDNPITEPNIIEGDARNVDKLIEEGIDLVITSPPYPNRMSYIRELRPYMYWTEYLVKAKEAGELDWKAIGGTWGVATSRLSEWESDKENGHYPDYFTQILEKIKDDKNSNGLKMSNYVARYFEDTLKHFQSLTKVLNHNATVNYVIGNSTFYDVLVPAEQLYKEIMGSVGFSNIQIKKIRKRNSKKQLFEFVVSGEYT